MNEPGREATTEGESMCGLAGHVIFRAVDLNEGYLLDLNARTLFSFNGTGLCLLQALARGGTEEQLRHALAKEFNIEPNECVADVTTFLAELSGAGLLLRTPMPDYRERRQSVAINEPA